ncbi:hypothetical protein SAMN02910400_01121 [Lachnospiraceae bacterium C10]|nr:hypothetical protein SAMN02910400_01121 [Lachnospiraceae bacterium C10]
MYKTKLTKRIMAVLLAVGVVIGATSVMTSQPVETEAAITYMKNLNLKTNIKKGKAYSFKTKYAVAGNKKTTWTLESVKFVDAKDGYKKCKIKMINKHNYTFTKAQAAKMAAYYENHGTMGGDEFFSVVDGKTGLSLEKLNDFDVTVKSSGKWSKLKKTYYNSDEYIQRYMKWTVNLTITYPENYDDLCIGFGGGNVIDSDTFTNCDYWEGTIPFKKTTYYKNGEKNSRWVQISEFEKKL